MENQACTVGERIVAYLEQLPVDELTTKDTWPADATQDGIAAAIGISRAHVNGNGVRRKVYRAIDERRYAVYTPEGERVPLVRAPVREIRVAYLRCPSCGKESRVALDT